jgi:hypothetical protein
MSLLLFLIRRLAKEVGLRQLLQKKRTLPRYWQQIVSYFDDYVFLIVRSVDEQQRFRDLSIFSFVCYIADELTPGSRFWAVGRTTTKCQTNN